MKDFIKRFMLIMCCVLITAKSQAVFVSHSPFPPEPSQTYEDIDDFINNTVFVFEFKGQKYYVENLEDLLSGKTKDTCIYNRVDGKIQKLYRILYESCRTSLNRKSDVLDFGDKVLKKIYSNRVSDFVITNKTQLKLCLIQLENIESQMVGHSYETKQFDFQSDLDSCIDKIAVINPSENSCPSGFAVQKDEYISNLRDTDLNALYGDCSYSFRSKNDIKNPLMAVFNGYILLICDNGQPQYLVQPTGSGAAMCQGGEYQEVPNTGSLPDGVYLASYSGLERMSKLTGPSWGKYRMPLIPAESNKTFNRGSFYLHGTTTDGKYTSGGCITLGTGIVDFIEGYYKKEGRDMIIFVNMPFNVQDKLK